MIRLAEAMAKMECSDEVNEKHVHEAYRYITLHKELSTLGLIYKLFILYVFVGY